MLFPQNEVVSAGTRYNVPSINSWVLYAGIHAIKQLQRLLEQAIHLPTDSSFPHVRYARRVTIIDNKNLVMNASKFCQMDGTHIFQVDAESRDNFLMKTWSTGVECL